MRVIKRPHTGRVGGIHNVTHMTNSGTILLMAISVLAGSFGTRGFCQAAEPIQAHLVRRIIGRTVENYDGDRLGKVKDFVVEMPAGRIEYVIISSGGVAGLNTVWKPVPPRAVSLATTKKNTVVLAGSKVQWEKAPTLKRREMPLLGTDVRLRAIYGFYGQEPPGAGTAQSAKTPGVSSALLASEIIG